MSDTGKAVFLSYASQDADAARRIADALRAAGVEVWFDQNELVGGDAWDQKIRKQIGSCALFVPIISANTQSRTEGYFRLEWRLADQRTHLMAKGRAFLLPVVIDDTRDTDAHVPDAFTEVQWTKLPSGEVPAAFVARVKQLLGNEAGPVSDRPFGKSTTGEAGQSPALPRKSRLWLIPVILGTVAIAVATVWLTREAGPVPAVDSPVAARQVVVPDSEARRLANQAMQLLENPNATRESSWLADELCERALKLDGGDAEIWAAAALASINLYWNTYDTSAVRMEKLRSQATRATQLDAKSVRAALAIARSVDLTYEKAESLQAIRDLHRRAPEDQHVLFHLIRAEGAQGHEAAVRNLLNHFRALPLTGMLSQTQVFVSLRLRQEGRLADAGQLLEEMFTSREPSRGAYYEKLQLLLGSWHDLAEVEPFLARIPVRYLQEPAFGSAIAQYWMWRGQPEKALQALAQVPQDYFEEFYAREPKALLTGWAHAQAGRPIAAQAEWRQALALVEERLQADSRNFALLEQHALLLALTGQGSAAREAWQLRVELGGEQGRPGFIEEARVRLALNEPERAIATIVEVWPKLPPGIQAWLLPRLRNDPAMAAIRDDGRMQRIFTEGATMLQRLKDEQTGGAKLAVDSKSVAVLAFANLSDDQGNEYFSDGISEELLNVLAKVPGLKVMARTSSFHFKGKDTAIADIARQLGVAYVVEGSVRKQGDKVRITAQLIKAADGFHVWSDTFTRDLKDIFAVQDEIAGIIAGQLQLKLGFSNETQRTVNPEAYRLVLEAHHFWLQRTDAALARAEALYLQALALDAEFARAHAGLAAVLMIRDWYRMVGGSPSLPADALRARSEVERALSLDPSLAEPHAVLGVLLYNEGKYAEAEQAFQTALRLNPNYSYGHHWRSHLLLANGDLKAALAGIDRAIQLDPLSYITLVIGSMWHSFAGRYDEALAHSERALGFGSEEFVPLMGGRSFILLKLGRQEEAVALARRMARDLTLQPRWWSDASAIHVLREAGFPQEAADYAERLLATLPADSRVRSFVLIALGRNDEALAQLARHGVPSSTVSVAFYSPLWDDVRDDPRFIKIITDLGLRQAYEAARTSRARLSQEKQTKP